MSAETVRLIRDGEKGRKGVRRRGEREIMYTCHYTVTTRMTPALRWAVIRAILMFLLIARDKVTRQCCGLTSERVYMWKTFEVIEFDCPEVTLCV